MKDVKIEFNEEKGEIFYDKISQQIVFRGEIAAMQRKFEKVIGPAAHHIIYETARVHAKKSVSDVMGGIIGVLGRLSQQKMADEMAKKLTSMGHGKVEICDIDLSKNYYGAKVYNSCYAMGYEKSDKPVCHFLRGLFAAGGSVVSKKELQCIETKCLAMGDEYCE